MLADPRGSTEGLPGPQHGAVRGVLRDDFDVEVRYTKGFLALAASTQLNVPPSTGPVVALSSGARAGIEYKVPCTVHAPLYPSPRILHHTPYILKPKR